MKLSEAILLGSIGTGQCYADLTDGRGNSCALGAALSAIGKLKEQYPALWAAWPWVKTLRVKNPSGDKNVYREATVEDMIWDLNDTAKWTRPQIAAWVASIEPHIDERKCETNEVSAQEETVAEPDTVQDAESQTVR